MRPARPLLLVVVAVVIAITGLARAEDETLPVLALAEKGKRVRAAHPARVMSNSFGFGGNNCTLVLGEPS